MDGWMDGGREGGREGVREGWKDGPTDGWTKYFAALWQNCVNFKFLTRPKNTSMRKY